MVITQNTPFVSSKATTYLQCNNRRKTPNWNDTCNTVSYRKLNENVPLSLVTTI